MRRFRTADRGLAGPLVVLVLPVILALPVRPATVAAQDAAGADVPDPERGRSHYIASCARCHGVGGGGGEGPPLARSTLMRAPDDEALADIITGGIPGTGMSGSWWLSPGETEQVVAYVRSLAPSGPDEAELLTGDPSRGRAIFDSEGCARCHTVGGFGTARGPDLTTVGARRGATHLREALVDPTASLPRGLTAMPRDFVDYLVVRVVDAEGTQVRGMRMNEDTYTIQIKDARGVLHSFYKPDLREFEREFDRSLMQSYADRLTDEQIEDLVAYLASLTGTRLRGIS
jgi:putative heme-binding domain-containing protein